MTRASWMVMAAAALLLVVERTQSQVPLLDLAAAPGLYHDSGWPPGQALEYLKLARDLKTQFFSPMSGDKQQQATEGNKRRDRITALFIKLMTRLFRHRPFQRLFCGTNATCLASFNTPAY